jgi:hypothetical protein
MYTGLLLASLALGGGKEAKVEEPMFDFKVTKDNSIVFVKESGRAVFVVSNPNGIGQATIVRKSGAWPANTVFRFQYGSEKGKGFNNLEHLTLTTDRIYAEGNLKASGKFAFFFLDAKRQKPYEVLDERRASGKLRVVVEPRDGALEATLPMHLLIGTNQLDLYWIDAYRN